MKGKIVKGIAGFYYVFVEESGIYECKAKGIFRKEGKKPLVGDEVYIEVLDEGKREANLTEILPRKNELIRPAVSNVDQAAVILALESPKPNGALLDRFLIMMEMQKIPVFICFNKTDLVSEEEAKGWKQIYESCGYDVVFLCADKGEGMEEIARRLKGKTTVVAGPSGVGKSTITNHLQKNIMMETGEISKKLKRGRHTTRHSELISIGEDGWICDTPGFTSLYTAEMDKEQLRFYYPELQRYEGDCRFQGCVHVSEPDCRVKQALLDGEICQERYDNYCMFFEELRINEKRKY